MDIVVQAQADHIASLASASPVAALEELIWNALDAGANEVNVDIRTNALGAVEAIYVRDDGTGIDVANVQATFGSLGGSWKRAAIEKAQPTTRALHGRHGRGRFKAFALGSHVEWNTTVKAGDKLESWRLTGELENPGIFHLSELQPGPGTGTEVAITNIRAAADVLTEAERAVQTLAVKFALYLKAYPNVRIYFGGLPVTPLVVQREATSYKLNTEAGATAKLELIEWRRKFPGSGRIVFCGGDGFALYEMTAGVRSASSFAFTAYLSSPRFDALAGENALLMDGLNAEVRSYLDAARKVIKAHFKVRSEETARDHINTWREEGSYPFATPNENFDVAAIEMRANIDSFDSLKPRERKYLFNLIAKMISK